MQNIEGKVVVITGASSGLGEAAARALAVNGASLVLGARRVERLQALADQLSLGSDAAVRTDVTDVRQVRALVDRAIDRHGRVDVILNNAGLMPHSPLERLKVDDWDRMIDVNIKGVLYGIAAVLPHMIRQRSGHIINVSSVAGHKVRPSSAVYAATKHAVRVISEGLRMEVKPHNIRTTSDFTGRGSVGTGRQHHRTRRRGGDAPVLRAGRGFGRFIRRLRAVRDEPARRRGHQRNPVPPDKSGTVMAGSVVRENVRPRRAIFVRSDPPVAV